MMDRTKGRALRWPLVVGLVLALGAPPPVSFGGEPATVHEATRQATLEKQLQAQVPGLRGGLAQALSRLAAASGGDRSDTAGAERIAVHVRVDGRRAPAVAADVERVGGDVRIVGTGAVEAYVEAGQLAAVSRIAGVHSVWPVLPRPRAAFRSPGVALHGADLWQLAGVDGTGVAVGIIDGGFAGLASLVGTEVPAQVVARCYVGLGTFTANLGDCANGDAHGTAVAETIADMAPGVRLFISDPQSVLEELQAIDWMVGNGVKVINASYASGYLFDGPGDGTTPYVDTSYAAVERATAGGALWVNSAGNEGDGGWTGPATDADGDRWLEFASGDDGNGFTIRDTRQVGIGLRWAEPWGASGTDYDLFVFPAGSPTPVASSVLEQNGNDDPFELIAEILPPGSYEISIRHHAGPPASRLQLLVYGLSSGIERQVASGTLPSPADSMNPALLAVGAVRYSSPSTIEPYSSRGPTLDGRIKPDLVAADCAPTTIEPEFCGTSQSAPYVTGAAALLGQAEPSLGSTALAARLRATAVPLGSPVPNSTFGWGRLSLGPPPAPSPVALAFIDQPSFEVAGRPFVLDPVVRVIDGSGNTTTAGPGATALVTLTASGGQLSCPTGVERPAAGGIASFTGCTASSPGTITLSATSSGLIPATAAATSVAAAGTATATVAITASPSPLSKPGVATFGLTLTPPGGSTVSLAGRTIDLQRSVDGLLNWATVASVVTDTAGAATAALTADRNASYRGVYRGGADLASGRAQLALGVRQTVVLRPTSSTVRVVSAGARVTFRATLRPVPLPGTSPRALFRIYRRVSGMWQINANRTVSVDAAGVATLAWRWGTRGSWYVRVVALANAGNLASAWSRIERYDVR